MNDALIKPGAESRPLAAGLHPAREMPPRSERRAYLAASSAAFIVALMLPSPGFAAETAQANDGAQQQQSARPSLATFFESLNVGGPPPPNAAAPSSVAVNPGPPPKELDALADSLLKSVPQPTAPALVELPTVVESEVIPPAQPPPQPPAQPLISLSEFLNFPPGIGNVAPTTSAPQNIADAAVAIEPVQLQYPASQQPDPLPLRPPPTDIDSLDAPPAGPMVQTLEGEVWYEYPRQATNGFAGPSGVVAPDGQVSPHFVPTADRWRIGFPIWDRYGPSQRTDPDGDAFENDNPYALGALINPFQQNFLKGDYPVYGQHTFVTLTASSVLTTEFRQVPTPTTPFESTDSPFQEDFFGDPDQFFLKDDFKFSIDVVHGDAGFKPADWRLRFAPTVNINYLDVEELAIVGPDVRAGTTRYRTFIALQEFFVERKLADTSPNYDFVSIRGGSQPFVSDFRGFIFADTNLAIRLFGTRHANRDQYNIAVFNQFEKETNSELNRFVNRPQNILVANYFRQDFIWPGYTAEFSFLYNQDRGDDGLVFDRNGFLVRPDPAGVFQPHRVDAFYLGWTGEGHINRFNVSNSFYYVFGEDDLNPIRGEEVDINAQMAALEVSYDRDWMRFRSSFFWASGDDDPDDNRGEGFDAILDNPNFVGGEFSYWQRQSIKLFGVNLVDRNSLVPHLRSSKIQGQTNFVNPGIYIVNFGNDIEYTPRLRQISNINFLWFHHTEVLEQFVFQDGINRNIGTDLSTGFEYRPFLNDNVILVAGVSGLLPGDGFADLYSDAPKPVNPLFASFIELTATY